MPTAGTHPRYWRNVQAQVVVERGFNEQFADQECNRGPKPNAGESAGVDCPSPLRLTGAKTLRRIG